MPIIIEGIVTSLNAKGELNVAPMGPIVAGDFDSLTLRPFQLSATFQNLTERRCGVFHVVDKVDLLVQAVLGKLDHKPDVEPAIVIEGSVLLDCCRWFEFRVDRIDASEPRSEMLSTIVHRGERRPFLGINRARNAIIEAAILASRLQFFSRNEALNTLSSLESPVLKTGGESELSSFQLLSKFVIDHYEMYGP